MLRGFDYFERRIDAVYARCPGEGRGQVVLTRLCAHTAKVLERLIDSHLSTSELNTSTWLGLLALYSSRGQAGYPSDVSDLAFSSRTNATRVVEDLERRGWVRRAPSTHDRRRVELRLTRAGVRATERLIPAQRRRLVEAWGGLSASEQATLERLLRKLLRSLSSAPETAEGR